MKIKRAIGFGAMLWVFAFAIISILMFTPWFKESENRYQIAWLVLEIPVVLLLAKWYFKTDPPTIKKGFLLGLVGIVTSVILDLVITIPLYVVPQSIETIGQFFLDWKMLTGYALLLFLFTYAGYEFDATYTDSVEDESVK